MLQSATVILVFCCEQHNDSSTAHPPLHVSLVLQIISLRKSTSLRPRRLLIQQSHPCILLLEEILYKDEGEGDNIFEKNQEALLGGQTHTRRESILVCLLHGEDAAAAQQSIVSLDAIGIDAELSLDHHDVEQRFELDALDLGTLLSGLTVGYQSQRHTTAT